MQLTAVLVLLLAALSSPAIADDKPNWVISPERTGFISVVGYAPKQASGGEAAQRRVALLKARQELAQMVRVRVEHTLEHEQQIQQGVTTHSANSSTRLTSQAALNMNSAAISAEWVDPANGNLYLLVELPE